MCISLLIPVFNYDASALLEDLYQQALQLEIEWELIVWDDGSRYANTDPNANWANLHREKVQYFKNVENKGRAATRLALAEAAHYEYLLFLDADSLIPVQNYLSLYCKILESEPAVQVVSGGRRYPDQKPADCRLMLHWTYGHRREVVAGSCRAFHSNNFLIKKALFISICGEKLWPQYGHEDSFWSIRLKQLGVPVYYTNNPVEHNSLEPAAVFLDKARQAIASLLLLEQLAGPEWLAAEVKLFRMHQLLKRVGLIGLIALLVKTCNTLIVKNLSSCRPSLRLFDLWRLAQLNQAMRK